MTIGTALAIASLWATVAAVECFALPSTADPAIRFTLAFLFPVLALVGTMIIAVADRH